MGRDVGGGLRVPEEEEISGIDQMTHAETAYELTGGLGTGSPTGTLPATRPAATSVGVDR